MGWRCPFTVIGWGIGGMIDGVVVLLHRPSCQCAPIYTYFMMHDFLLLLHCPWPVMDGAWRCMVVHDGG